MQILSLFATIITGLALGLVINLLSDMLPEDRKPECSHCGADQEIKNYLLLKPCEYCWGKQRMRFWVVLAVYVALAVVFWFFPPERLGLWRGLLLMAYFGVVFIIDMEHRLILRSTSIVGVLICGYLGWRMHDLKDTLLGGLAGFAIMLALYYFGILFTKILSRRREEPVDEVALGFGDVNLSLILGLLLGWPGITAGLFFAVFAGGLGSGIYILINKLTGGYENFTAIPYAPFLLFSAAALIFVLPVTS